MTVWVDEEKKHLATEWTVLSIPHEKDSLCNQEAIFEKGSSNLV